ncbi:MAG: N-acetyl-gamma-glutamyl-phosphate reductase, partial [Bacteroidota bacterium]|nr:N-acetyl-gamma-glutamyl-phosphate reductase [Bacteroidota bacterium]
MTNTNTKEQSIQDQKATKKVRAGIIGGAGYTGGEMIRLLIHHPDVELVSVVSSSNAGNPVSKVHGDLTGETDLRFAEKMEEAIDVCFLCVGHGDARNFLSANTLPENSRIIDLSQDFRLTEKSTLSGKTFVYGLPELNRETIRSAKYIANPGCFATAIQLGLLPLAKAGILGDVYTTGITGSTGAGQGLSQTSHFSWRANNIQAYKSLQHQHLHEILQSLRQLQGNDGMYVHFVPWRGDFTRGIYISSVIDCGLPLDEIRQLYQQFYDGQPFTHVSDAMIDLKQVVNTNKCLIYLEKQGSK